MGKNIVDFVMQCEAWKKIKGRGGEFIKGHGTIYTPTVILIRTLIILIRNFQTRVFAFVEKLAPFLRLGRLMKSPSDCEYVHARRQTSRGESTQLL